ncbi:MAG TPA: hypothetical protein DEG76_14100 [Pseudohongiella sp.]|nr:hypothetical protein [Pseudohongiella sp.]|tara:strand:- start:1013 stop:1222 length:210 start_codon:yes stop_codon:yes gene_type:complete
MISLFLFVTLCFETKSFAIKICAIDRSKHKPCFLTESIFSSICVESGQTVTTDRLESFNFSAAKDIRHE